eukprot:2577711-Pleurochrysis_carterae.AAC.1
MTSPGLTPPLQTLANLRCQHSTHPDFAAGLKTSSGWTRHCDTPAGLSAADTIAYAGNGGTATHATHSPSASADRTAACGRPRTSYGTTSA